jgi:spore germination protein KB
MNPEKIGGRQFVFIIILFEIGTTVLFGLQMKAKQDEWLAILAAMAVGLALMWVFTKLYEYYPNQTLIQMILRIVGKWLGYPLAVIYILTFAYESSRVLRDFGDLLIHTILEGTPVVVVMAGFMLAVVFCLRGGVETFGRMSELLLALALFAFFLGWVLIFASQLQDFNHLAPVLGEGIQPIWKAAFPFLIVFPFGQALVFMMFFPALKDDKKIKKIGMIAILISGILLAVNMLGLIAVFGPDLIGKIEFPLYTAIGMVDLADFIMNLDAFAILMMVLGGFFKLGVFMYAAVLGSAQLCKLKTYHPLIIPWGALITALSIFIASNHTEHLYIGWIISIPYIFFPLYVVVPLLLLIVAAIRKKIDSRPAAPQTVEKAEDDEKQGSVEGGISSGRS